MNGARFAYLAALALALAAWPIEAGAALQEPAQTLVGSSVWVALNCGASAPSVLVQNNSAVNIYLSPNASTPSITAAIVLKPDASPQIPGRGTWYALAASGASNDVRCMGIQP